MIKFHPLALISGIGTEWLPGKLQGVPKFFSTSAHLILYGGSQCDGWNISLGDPIHMPLPGCANPVRNSTGLWGPQNGSQKCLVVTTGRLSENWKLLLQAFLWTTEVRKMGRRSNVTRRGPQGRPMRQSGHCITSLLPEWLWLGVNMCKGR